MLKNVCEDGGGEVLPRAPWGCAWGVVGGGGAGDLGDLTAGYDVLVEE